MRISLQKDSWAFPAGARDLFFFFFLYRRSIPGFLPVPLWREDTVQEAQGGTGQGLRNPPLLRSKGRALFQREASSSGTLNLEMPTSWSPSSWLGFPCEKQVLLLSLASTLGSIPGSFVLCARAGEGLFEAVFTKEQKIAFMEKNGAISSVPIHLDLFCFWFEVWVYVSHAHLWEFSKLASP